MIGTGRQVLEATVSQPHADESDPLLVFSSELDTVDQLSQVESAPEPTVQTIAAPVDAAPPPPPVSPSIPIETLIPRLDRLEAALDDSRAEVSALKSEVATLVRTIGEITNTVGDLTNTVGDLKNTVGDLSNTVGGLKNTVGDLKKRAPRPEVTRTAMGWPGSARVSRTASAIMAAVTGLGAGIFGWVYFTGPADSRLGAGPEPAQETAFAPADQPVAPPATSPSAAPVAVPVAARAPAAGTRINYFGTLSVDSEPGGEVFLNRQSAGHTPLRFTKLKAGSHLIWIERDGYRRFTRVIEVRSDRVTRLFADLEPLPAR